MNDPLLALSRLLLGHDETRCNTASDIVKGKTTGASVHTLELRNLGSRRYEARLEYPVGGEPVVVLMNGSRDRNANSIFLRGRTDVGFLECRGFVDMARSTFAQDEPIRRGTLVPTYSDETCPELEYGQCASRLNASLRAGGGATLAVLRQFVGGHS